MSALFISIAAVLCINFALAETFVSGFQSGVWTAAGNPYFVTDNIIVHSDSQLTIEEGVRLEFQGPFSLGVNGSLMCLGDSDSIRFTQDIVAFPERWRGIQFDQIADLSILQFVIIEYANGSPHGSLILSSAQDLLLQNCTLRDCQVSGIKASDAVINIDQCAFERCGVGGACGGALNATNSTGSITGSKFLQCGSMDGAAICLYSSSLQIEQCEFLENRAILWGGAIFSISSEVVVRMTRFEGNIGLTGGVLYMGDGPVCVFDRCLFRNNTANRDGLQGTAGVAQLNSGEGYLFKNCIFDNNTASNITTLRAVVDCQIRECVFINNVDATLFSGGGIDVRFSDIYPLASFGADVPNDIGILAALNSNSDSVDVYGNLILPPDFAPANPEIGEYYPNFSSPLIDAGDTTEPRDLDGTYGEIGIREYVHLPVVDDLTIQKLDDSADLLLRWTSPRSTCRFRVYRTYLDEWDWDTVELIAETPDTFFVHQNVLTEPLAKCVYRITSVGCDEAR